MSLPTDLSSSADLSLVKNAREWEQTAMKKRPWRIELFELITRRLASHTQGLGRVLELGSGQGMLARYVLESIPSLPHYVLLDHSPTMQAQASERLGSFAARASFLERDFRAPGWAEGLGPFDAVVTVQAVHELRHKRYATSLHAQVRQILAPHGLYLVCDHNTGPDGIQDQEHYMSSEEQAGSLCTAGFAQVERLSERSGLTLHLAR